MKDTNTMLKSFVTWDDQSKQLDVLKQCNQLLQSLDKNNPETALMAHQMASRVLLKGMHLFDKKYDKYHKPTAPPPPPIMAALSIQGHMPMVRQLQLPFA
jgi:hypothetical protein